jgi:hypothetical protein
LAQFLAYRHSFPIGQPSPLDSYITSDPFTLGTLIALMMKAACIFEMLVNIQFRTRQYIPEDSELHILVCLKLDRFATISFSLSLGLSPYLSIKMNVS